MKTIKMIMDVPEDLHTQYMMRSLNLGTPLNEVLDKIRTELHATAEMHEDENYYLRDEWVDEIIDKYRKEQE